MENIEFRCNISENVIEYRCSKDINKKDVFMEYTYLDPNLPKSFFVLLRTSINSLKSKGYTCVVQTVSKYDWDNFLKSNNKWKIRQTDIVGGREIVIIECKIEDAIESIAVGLGISA